MSTIDYFAMLGVGFPASTELSSGANESAFAEAKTLVTFRFFSP
jgi:hypothetical protein